MQQLLQPVSRKAYSPSSGGAVCKVDKALSEESVEEKMDHTPCEKHTYNRDTAAGMLSMSPVPLSLQGGVWLELVNSGPMQLIHAVIYSKHSKALVSKGFVLPQGKSSFFWSLDNVLWPNGTYELVIRSEKQMIRRKLTK
ncbi:hypothetical protein [Cesiribacter sp. SM1]|uniref:hypothetical protein n=1 Tax=Cesiribacter sp. SM1 TaxID=2861196 RepID=UPI001CD63467|nr:hypothetical protein [Cesiribacter sp. SM1]